MQASNCSLGAGEAVLGERVHVSVLKTHAVHFCSLTAHLLPVCTAR